MEILNNIFDINSVEYKLISKFYLNKTAKRSGVALINHIDEGLLILSYINASQVAMCAYCIHPLLQSDTDLLNNYYWLNGVDSKVIILAMEYRSVANEYLSHRKINSIDEIRLSPLDRVNVMLIADKIQNRKDFELYHKGTHPRSEELDVYFKNWLKRLNITEEFYQEVKQWIIDKSI